MLHNRLPFQVFFFFAIAHNHTWIIVMDYSSKISVRKDQIYSEIYFLRPKIISLFCIQFFFILQFSWPYCRSFFSLWPWTNNQKQLVDVNVKSTCSLFVRCSLLAETLLKSDGWTLHCILNSSLMSTASFLLIPALRYLSSSWPVWSHVKPLWITH